MISVPKGPWKEIHNEAVLFIVSKQTKHYISSQDTNLQNSSLAKLPFLKLYG